MKFLRIVFLSIFLFTSTLAHSQRNSISFENISTGQGLSQSTVTCIFQDSRGFMWFGTRDGLNKYDGYKFTIYKEDPEKEGSLSNSNVFDILEDEKGNIWVATWGGGLNVYDRTKGFFRSFRHNENDSTSISNDALHCLAIDGDDLWIGTNIGLNKFNVKTETFTRYLNNPDDSTSLSNNKMESILLDSKGNIWVGTIGGLNLYNKESDNFIRFTHQPGVATSLSNDRVFSLFEDSKENLWVGTYGGGLNKLNKNTKEFTAYKNQPNDPFSLSHNVVKAIEEDENGSLWIGTENGGLNIFDKKTQRFISHTHDEKDIESLRNNSIYSIYKDQKGNMWIGTYSGGIDFFNRDSDKFFHYKNTSSPYSLSNNTVSAIYEDSKANIWIGTDGGGLNLFDINTGTFSSYKHEPGNNKSIGGDFLLSVIEDSRGELWIGTYGSGITVFNKEENQFRHYKNNPNDPKSLSSNNAWSMIEDREENVWIGTFGQGLERYDRENDSFIHYKHDPNNPQSLSENFIHVVFEDREGNIIVGLNAGGIDIYDKKSGSFSNIKPKDKDPNSLSNSTVNCFYEDELGNLWVGTQSGLNYWDRKSNTFKVYKTKDGLPSDKIWGILPDKNNDLWISTNSGLSRFNLSTKTFKNYDIEDGLQSNEFSKGYCRTKSGHMYFGGINGFNAFLPETIKSNHPYDPNILITDFEILNAKVPIKGPNVKDSPLEKHINETENIVLSYDDAVISFEFASMNFVDQKKKKYSYILEGFDKGWNEIESKNNITYTNLDPGQYTLKLKGLNNEGEWSDKIRYLNITITPPYWRTWWFKGLLVIFSFGGISAIFLVRMNIVKKQKDLLEKQVLLRTLELQNANVELTGQKEEIDHQKEKIEELYTDIKDSIRAAQVIQDSILPSSEYIKKYLPEIFILNKPKDLVSGDFYWFEAHENKILIAAVDCTGHGVSGAFMSIHGHHLLNQAVHNGSNYSPSEILDQLNQGIIYELHQDEGKAKTYDGMDIALCVIDKENMCLEFAGANSPLYIVRDGDVIQIKPNKFSVGLSVNGEIKRFNNNKLPLQKGDTCYIFSDGYADQLGGADSEKFMYFRFRELLISFNDQPMEVQKSALDDAFNKWKGANEQLDDILVIGFKIS